MGSPFGFVGPTYKARSLRIGAEECVNLIPSPVANGLKKELAYYAVPGFSVFATLTDGPVRAQFYEDGRYFVVGGGTLFEVAWDGTVTSRGSVTNDGRPAWFASNGAQGHQLAIVTGNAVFILDTLTNVLTRVTDAECPSPAATGLFTDGYFIILNGSTGLIALSALFDGFSYDGTEVALRSTVSDRVIHILKDHDEVWLMGTKTMEPWRNTGDTFPFAPIEGARVERGLLVPPTACNVNKGFAFLSDGPSVWYVEQSAATQISTPAIDDMLRSYASVNDAEGYAREYGGNVCYVLMLPTAKTTLVYNFTTNLWHEERAWDANLGRWSAHPARSYCRAFGEFDLVGDRSNGIVYKLLETVHDFNGSPRRWLRRAPHIGTGARRMFHDRLHLDCEMGVGISTGQGSNPQVMLRYSDDWGKTYSSEEWLALGAGGEYGATAEAWGLGAAEGPRVYELSGSDPVAIAIRDMTVDIRQGSV